MKNLNIHRERRGWFRVNIKNFFFQIQPLKKLIPHGSQISILIFHLSLSPYLLQEYLFMANFFSQSLFVIQGWVGGWIELFQKCRAWLCQNNMSKTFL